MTKTSCLGMWVPVHDEDWDGDVFMGSDMSSSQDSTNGTGVFKGNNLPWLVGQYEVRYHHDGKYNVMSMDGPLEIFGSSPFTLSILVPGELISAALV